MVTSALIKTGIGMLQMKRGSTCKLTKDLDTKVKDFDTKVQAYEGF